MSEANPYQKNLAKFMRAYPETGNALEATDCSHLQFCETRTGQLNLVRIKGNDRNYYHSETDAESEAGEWVFNHVSSKTFTAVIFGIGLGYIYEALLPWLQGSSARTVIILEDDLALFKRFLETERASRILADKRVIFHFFEMPGVRGWGRFRKELDWVFYSAFTHKSEVSACDAYLKWRPTESGLIIRQFNLRFDYFNELRYSMLKMRRMLFRNYYDNLIYVDEASLIHDLKNKFPGIPALICGAGPSLQKLFDKLSNLKDRVLIFGSGTAMNILTRNGFAPHFGIALDPNVIQESRYLAAEAYEIPYFFFTRFYKNASRWLQNPLIYVEVHSGANFFAWLNEKLGIVKSFKKIGRSSSTTCTAIAGYLGANTIVLTGMNLAYSEGARYAAGAAFYPATDINPSQTKRINSPEYSAVGAKGEEMETNWVWVEESGFYGEYIGRNPEKSILNVTEGGLQIPNIPSLGFEEISARYFRKSYDLDGWIHAEMEMAKKVGGFSGHLLTGFTEWRDSLRRLSEYYGTPPLSVDISKWSDRLRNAEDLQKQFPLHEQNPVIRREPAYAFLLNSYEQLRYFPGALLMNMRKRHPDECDDNSIGEQLLALENERYAFFKSICDENLAISEPIYELLKTRYSAAGASSPAPSSPGLSPGELYARENGRLELHDPELQLDHRGEWIPDDRFELRYESGTLKGEMFYKDGELHGPSSFYREDGGLLAQTWFLAGKRVGKARYYDSRGGLKALMRYREGKREGRQEYFYPDGTLRTLLEYRLGKLHGDVLLYYPDGKMKRSQHFENGLREGFERLWDNSGLLVAEMEYRNDEPVGLLKTWHPNGKQSKEVRFHGSSRDYDLTLWDETGTLIKKETSLPDNPLHAKMAQSASLEKSLAELKQKLERYTHEKIPKKDKES